VSDLSDFIPMLPSKPPHMSREAWEQACVVPHCVRLVSGECKTPCSSAPATNEYHVQCDHILSRANGGKNESGNYQWLCKGQNQRKWAYMDSEYGREGWFDSRFNKDKLRIHQQELAWDKVMEFADVFASSNEQLFAVFFLLAWIVGGGKTIGNLAVLFAINQCINRTGPGQRRIKRTLFLVHQRELVDSLHDELKKDAHSYKIVGSKPRIIKIKSQTDWDRVRTGEYDIAVACTQAIWVPDSCKAKRLTEAELSAKLAVFEAVVVDECHFAPERWLQLIRMMPKAFKIASTATPMYGDGQFLASDDRIRNRLIALSSLTYEEARSRGCVKEVLPFEDGCVAGKYVCIEGGKSVEVQRGVEHEGDENTTNANNLVQLEAMVAKAASDMREDDRNLGFSSHAIIKSASIAAANDIACRINAGLSGKMPSRNGFRCAVLHSGDQSAIDGELPGSLEDWMAAKANEGQVVSSSCRFLATVQVGQFGLNNPPCTTVLYADATESVVDIVQRIGRAMRGSSGTVRVYYRRADQDKFEPRLKAALEYMLDMETKLRNAGFLWIDDWAMQTDSKLDRPAAVPLLSEIERRETEKVVGRMCIDNVTEDNDEYRRRIGELVSRLVLPGPGADEKRASLDAYADALRHDGEDRRRILGVPIPLEPSRTKVVVKDEPPADYSNERLIEALRQGVLEDGGNMAEAVRRVNDGDLLRTVYVQRLRNWEQQFYEPPKLTTPMTERCKSLASDLGRGLPGYNHRLHYDAAIKSVYLAAAWWFGVPNVKKQTIEAHEAHYVNALTRWQHVRPVMAVAKALMIDKVGESLPELAALWKTIGREVCDAVGVGDKVQA
jgi:superfamily II DNA/RNA helicase